MLQEVLRELDPKPGDVVCDCTLGGAGHSVELAKKIAPEGLSIGIDQDDMALAAAAERFEREVPQAEHKFLKGNFGDLDELLVQAEVPGVDCFLFDLGVSSPQLDIPERGFSFHEDAPLDMRMDSGNNTLTAAEVINHYNETDLTRILRVYGDEKFAARIARKVVEAREKAPIETTLQLVDVIKQGIPAAARRSASRSTTSSTYSTAASGRRSAGPTPAAESASSLTTRLRIASSSMSSRSSRKGVPALPISPFVSAGTCRYSRSRPASPSLRPTRR